MNITFLVGNGFDINLGLQTSYKDFYKWYIKQESSDENIKKIKEYIKEDIQDNNGEKWSDLEAALGECTGEFDNFEGFFNCHIDITKKLREYLKEEEKKFNLENISEKQLDDMRKSLLNFYKGLRDEDYNQFYNLLENDIKNRSSFINFISFNYTFALDNIVKKMSEKSLKLATNSNNIQYSFGVNKKVIHVHGFLDDSPILGVNDESQVKNKALFENTYFKGLIIKEEAVNIKRTDWQRRAENIIKNSNIICIYGMSLGNTDYKWWELIKGWLSIADNRYLIIYLRIKDNELNFEHPVEEQMKIDEGKALFFRHFGNIEQSQIDELAKRVFVIFNSENILNIPVEKETQKVTTEKQLQEATI